MHWLCCAAELMEGYVELMKLKGEDVSALDQSAIEFEVEQVLDAVDFDKNGFIEYSGGPGQRQLSSCCAPERKQLVRSHGEAQQLCKKCG